MRVITVSDVRQRLYWASDGPRQVGHGAPSTATLGRIFHEVFSSLAGDDAGRNMVRPLSLADATLESWENALVKHAFATVVSPALASNEVMLQGEGQTVLNFWIATQALCAWLAQVMHERRELAEEVVSLETLRSLVFSGAEVELAIELNDSKWPDSVLLQGRADGLLARRGDAKRCILELKLGRTHPEADLLQGCLYQLLLSRQVPSEADAALGMMSFGPTPRERLFEAAQLRQAQAALMDVIGEIAGFGGQPDPASRASLSTQVAPRLPAPSPSITDQVSATEIEALRRSLGAAFEEYGTPLTIAPDAVSGCAFTRFYASPKRGVSVRSIERVTDNVWTRLQTSKPPRVALEHGRIAIDVERTERMPAPFEFWQARLMSGEQSARNGASRVAVGVTVDGKLLCADLSDSQSPHMLVVGTTGSGKSEWLRAMIASLLFTNTPAKLRLALIDPKRLAFAMLAGSRFLWKPVVYDEGAVELLDALVEEMEQRYMLFQHRGADDLAAFNAGASEIDQLPRIVCVCDEFADLLLRDRTSRRAIEDRVARLGVKGRAAGVHLVFATQRAGREILKGTIDSNLPARVALAVPRANDSRLILGERGAESLLGKGDLLYKDIGAPVRAQGLVVSKEALTRLASGS
jgi:hypothetical protein